MGRMEEFKRKYPRQNSDIMGREFAGAFSVITFDYPMAFPTNRELTDAIAALLRDLGVKAFLVGQSLGGFIAQLVAKHHPDVVAGMVLSNTGTLSTGLSPQGAECLTDMVGRTDTLLKLIRWIPFGMVKRSMRRSILKMVDQTYENDIIDEFMDEIMHALTKEYEIHMLLLLKDLVNHWDMEPADFARFEDRVMLILSDDDETFNDDVKQALIAIMPNPEVVTDIRGGHLALLLKIDRYIQTVVDFVNSGKCG